MLKYSNNLLGIHIVKLNSKYPFLYIVIVSRLSKITVLGCIKVIKINDQVTAEKCDRNEMCDERKHINIFNVMVLKLYIILYTYVFAI